MGRRNESIDFLLECIANSLIDLMKYKKFIDITVNEIVNRSGVSRATYFRHFESKYDILIYRLKTSWSYWCIDNDVEVKDKFDINNAYTFFAFNYQNRDLLKLLYDNDLTDVILYAFYSVINEEKESYANAFYNYGMFGILSQWVKNDFRESPEEMAKTGIELVRLNSKKENVKR